jgi:hypothetical protein
MVFGTDESLKAGQICDRIGKASYSYPQTKGAQYHYLVRWRDAGLISAKDYVWRITPPGWQAIDSIKRQPLSPGVVHERK